MPYQMKLARLFLLTVSLPSVLFAGEVTITLPPETGSYKAAPGVELAQANCLSCHSTEYVATQPPMPRKFWEATVKKMKDKYGAATPEAQVSALVDYLAATYGAQEKRTP
jgi:mono/diheme cytochrome c family protein